MNTDILGYYATRFVKQHPEALAAAGTAVATFAADVVLPAVILAAGLAVPVAVAGGVVYGVRNMVNGD